MEDGKTKKGDGEHTAVRGGWPRQRVRAGQTSLGPGGQPQTSPPPEPRAASLLELASVGRSIAPVRKQKQPVCLARAPSLNCPLFWVLREQKTNPIHESKVSRGAEPALNLPQQKPTTQKGNQRKAATTTCTGRGM